MDNEKIARQIEEDVELYGLSWRSAFSFDIRRIMQKKGLKNIDIAERLNVSEANISRMLRGDQNIKIETMYMLAAAVDEQLLIYVGSQSNENSAEQTTIDFESETTNKRWARRNFDHWSTCANEVMEEADESALAFG